MILKLLKDCKLCQLAGIAAVFFIQTLCGNRHLNAQSVDKLTGRLEMSIPLGKLESNDISIPISVYHGGESLRVAEGEGDCGMGWNLLAAGSVTRIVKGLPDEVNTNSKKGWLFVHNSDSKSNAQRIQSFVPSSDNVLGGSCSDEAQDWSFLEGHLDSAYVNDTEPDIFFISAPGLSASFVFDAAGVPKLLSAQDVIVIPNLPNGFTIKTNNGLIYNFADLGDRLSRIAFISKKSDRVPTECLFYKSYKLGGVENLNHMVLKWSLTSLTSARTGTTANFDYLPALLQGVSRTYYSSDSLHFLQDVSYEAKISKISLKSFSASFRWAGSLLDVKFEESNSSISREIRFDYFSALNTVSQTSKSFLRGINFKGGNCLPTENYAFEYFDVNYVLQSNNVPNYINWKKNWQQDYFGFPNVSALPNKNLPQLYFYFSASNENRLRVDGIKPGWTKIIPGQDRGTFSVLFFGALKKITYPTGGFTEIEYEKNFYFDPSVQRELFGGGVRVKKIITNGGEAAFGKAIENISAYRSIEKEYEYKDASGNTSSGRLLSPIKLGYILHDSIKQTVNNLGEPLTILYSRVKEKIIGKGYTLYEYNIPGMFPETSNREWKATRTRIARKPRIPCLNSGYLATGFYLYPYPPSTNYEFRRGTLARTATYSETGALISERVNSYTTLTKDPSIIKGLRFEKIADIYHYGVYEILTGRLDVVNKEVVKEASQENPSTLLQTTTSFSYNQHNLLRTVTTSMPDGTVKSKSITYAKDFLFTNPTLTDTAAVGLKALNDANRGSELVEEISYLKLPLSSTTVTSANLITYRKFENGLVLPYYLRSTPPGITLTPALINGQNFVFDNDYKIVPTTTWKEYDSEGRVLSKIDNKRNWSSMHYSTDLSFPVATFTNAKASQCIFEGFDTPSTFGLSKSDESFQVAPGWTGDKALVFVNGFSKLISSPLNLIQKNGNTYKISCWVYGLQNRTLTFKAVVSSLEVATVVLTNPISNKWNYLEGEMNTSAIAEPFSLEISADASMTEKVTVDDIVFAPMAARVSLQTVSPYNGITSTTDDLGNSSVVVYDQKGRKAKTLDRFRNLIQKFDYAVKNETNPEPLASFASNKDRYFIGTPVTFTPLRYVDPCDPNTAFSWEVDGIGQPSGVDNSLTFSFATIGVHNVKLTVTNSAGISRSHTKTICVEYLFNDIYSVITVDQNGNPRNSYTCAEPNVQIHPEFVGPPVPEGCSLTVKWSESEITSLTTKVTTYTATYTIDCSAYKECLFAHSVDVQRTASAWVTYVMLENCE